MSATHDADAATYLKHARAFRARAEVSDALEYAQAAYQLAVDAGDGETAYRSRACVGHLYLYRAEYGLSYEWYRRALAEAEARNVRRWIGPAHHDCWLSGTEADMSPDVTDPHGEGLASGWGRRPVGAWRFVHDVARRINGDTGRARFLASAALSASWHTTYVPPGGDEYLAYASRFERMIAYASMVQGFGACGMRDQWQGALNLFDMAADALGTDEGYALCLLECADGTQRIGEHAQAEALRARAARVAQDRGEPAVDGARAWHGGALERFSNEWRWMMDAAKVYHGWLTTLPDTVVTIYADTRGKAKGSIFAAALDAFGHRGVSFTEVRVRKGPAPNAERGTEVPR